MKKLKNVEDNLKGMTDYAHDSLSLLYREILDSIQAIVLSLDVEGRIIYINPFGLKISGFTFEELEKKDWLPIFIDREMRAKTGKLFFTEKNIDGNTREAITKDGRKLYIEWHCKSKKNAEGKITGSVCLGVDITERKKSEELIQEKEKIKKEDDKRFIEKLIYRLERFTSLGHLSSAISHEIKQPLHSIKLLTDSILYLKSIDKQLSYNEILEDIKEISERVDKINKIISNLNLLIKAPEKIEPGEININKEIKKVIDFYDKKIKSHCITLVLELFEGDILGFASEIQFQQILINLINNSINALDKVEKSNKIIIINTGQDTENAILKVIDNGVGFKKEKKENLFNPFFSVDPLEENLGMGLYIVNNILKCFNGSIELDNNELHGATVTIKLKKKRK